MLIPAIFLEVLDIQMLAIVDKTTIDVLMKQIPEISSKTFFRKSRKGTHRNPQIPLFSFLNPPWRMRNPTLTPFQRDSTDTTLWLSHSARNTWCE